MQSLRNFKMIHGNWRGKA